MAQAWWKPDKEVCSARHDAASGRELLLQKGAYHFHDPSRSSEAGYRVVWRIQGRLRSRPARFTDLDEIEALIEAGRAEGWV